MMETFPNNQFQNALSLAYILVEKMFLSHSLLKCSLQVDKKDIFLCVKYWLGSHTTNKHLSQKRSESLEYTCLSVKEKCTNCP